ncbi:rho guanine nucleotide exchange factor 7 [Trichonephila clavipes]|nr:rho guanine nucleotide exchange factor 7 [Trichonephila clavipes]
MYGSVNAAAQHNPKEDNILYNQKIYLSVDNGTGTGDALGKFMEEHSANPPGILTLTTGLSKPFRRLEKYPALLLELLRHTPKCEVAAVAEWYRYRTVACFVTDESNVEIVVLPPDASELTDEDEGGENEVNTGEIIENHIDRGDTQRAASLYRDIANTCAAIRKQKEMEFEIMAGNIKGWEGEPIHTLGNIVHLGSVVFLTDDHQRSSRFLVAFPETLVILSAKLGSFTYEGKLPLSSLIVRKMDSSEGHPYAFEINGNLIQRITVICSSADSLNQWLNVFPSHSVRNSTPGSRHATLPRSSPSHSSQMRTSISPINSMQTLPMPQSHSSRSSSPEDKPNNRIAAAARQVTKKVWPNWNLRPHPPMRASLTSQNEVKLRRSNSYKKDKDHDSEGDLPVRQMLESINCYDRSRNTMPSGK